MKPEQIKVGKTYRAVHGPHYRVDKIENGRAHLSKPDDPSWKRKPMKVDEFCRHVEELPDA